MRTETQHIKREAIIPSFSKRIYKDESVPLDKREFIHNHLLGNYFYA